MNTALAQRTDANVDAPDKESTGQPSPDLVALPGGRRSPRRRSRWWLIAAATVGIGVVLGVWQWYPQLVARVTGHTGAAGASLGFVAPKADAGAAKTPQRVETMPVEVAPRCDVLRLTGSLVADERSAVASNTSGIAAEVRVDRGSLVRKGDVLVQIDATDAKNKLVEGQAMFNELKARLGLEGDLSKFNPEDQPEVRLAKASAALAASNLKRAKELHAKKVISNEAFDQTETEQELATQRYRQALLLIRQAFRACETAQAKVAILEKAVADTTIRAPFDGWVAERHVAVGEQISSGMQATKVVTLVRINPLRLALTVPQQDIKQIRFGQTVLFRVDTYPDREFKGQVQFITPAVNDTRSMIVEAVVPNPECELRPGLFATAKLELPGRQSGMFVPASAVVKSDEVGKVFVVRDGAAREVVVSLGEEVGGKIEVRTGLTGRERVIVHPEGIKDGDVVR
jgi:RND family efflux transporter MFP subunit